MPIIFHIDMDYFFAQVEEVLNPNLKGKPLVVGSDPKEGKGRGIVTTCNYEARKFGLHSAMPISKAYRLCKDATYVLPKYQLYVQTSKRLMKIFKKYSTTFQQTSIDEMYVDMSDCGNFEKAQEIAQKIKDEVQDKEKLTCSIGIGPNKLIAKIASDYNKPDGLTVVRPKDVQQFLDPMSIRKLIGIGPKSEKRLNDLGIKKVKDLRLYSHEKLIRTFGKYGHYLHNMAEGVGSINFNKDYKRKSVGRQRTFSKDTKDKKEIFDLLQKISDEVHNDITKRKLMYKTIALVLRFEDFETHTKQVSMHFPTNKKETIMKHIIVLIEEYLHDKRKMRLVGIRLTNLSENSGQQSLV